LSVILTQTDTTVGFLSQDADQLCEIKSRDKSKPFLKVYPSFKLFLKDKNRVPNSKKAMFRRVKKTTFIINNKASRVASLPVTSKILQNRWYFSTSANQSGKSYDKEFCESRADVIVENHLGLSESSSSTILKINHKKIRRLR